MSLCRLTVASACLVQGLGLVGLVQLSIERRFHRQLLDYRRFVKEAVLKCASLLSEVPRGDLLEFLAYANVLIHVPQDQDFVLIDGRGQKV